jgi:hypothetical protein
MTKKEAVRQPMDNLGPDAKPTQLRGYVKDYFGIDMTLGHVSVTKREIRNEAAGKKTRSAGTVRAKKTPAQRSAARQVEPAAVAPVRPSATPPGACIGLDDIEAVKGLVERRGGRRGPHLLRHGAACGDNPEGQVRGGISDRAQ